MKSSFKIEELFVEIDEEIKPRRVRVVLPKTYDQNTNTTYPVLYMLDGQNLLFDDESFAGHSWRVLETISDNDIPELIVVGIDNDENKRVIEYSPWPFAFEPESGMGEKHATWIVNIVKPMIDQNYRTKPDKRNTLLAGSSLGGLMSAYMGATYPNIFGCLGIFSLASWICEDAFLDYVAQNHLDVNTKVYIQVGTQEGKGMESDFEDININQVYIDCSLSYYRMLAYSGHNIKLTKLKIFDQETHFEKDWAKHLPEFLKFSLIDK